MRFTPATVVAQMQDRSTRFREAQVAPDQLARTLTAGLRMFAEDVTDADEERLAEFQVIDNATVIADPDTVDISLSNTLEWLTINGINWRSLNDPNFLDEITLVTGTARLRAQTEFLHMREPIAYYINKQNLIRKVDPAGGIGLGTSWQDVFELQIYGVLIPDAIAGRSGMSVILGFPRPMMEALTWWSLIALSSTFKPAGDELQLWGANLAGEMQRMGVEARDARWAAEDIALQNPDI